MTYRFVDTQVKRPRNRLNIAYRVAPTVQIGVEYNGSAGEFTPTANVILQTETEDRPMISIGTSSDRIFSPPHKQAYFITAAKAINEQFAPYIGLSYSEWGEKVLMPFGANFRLSDCCDLLGMNDGVNTHLLLTHRMEGQSVSLMLIKMKYLGVSYSIGIK